MWAMPSPTERTCPTSVSSASFPKLAISFFRIAEISAGRISISADLFHACAERIELGAERAVDYAGPEFHNDPADDLRIDLRLDVDRLAAGQFGERGLQGLDVSVRQGLG